MVTHVRGGLLPRPRPEGRPVVLGPLAGRPRPLLFDPLVRPPPRELFFPMADDWHDSS